MHKNKMRIINPTNQNEVFKQYVECDNERSAWFAVSAKWMEETKKNPFGILQRQYKGAYRLCINGELQRVKHYSDFTRAGTTEAGLLDCVQKRAFSDFRNRTNTDTRTEHYDALNCWNLKIVSSSAEFIGNMTERIQYDADHSGWNDPYVRLRKVNTALITQDEEAQVFGHDDFRIFV